MPVDERSAPVALPRLLVAEAASFPGPSCIVVVRSAAEADALAAAPREHIAWLEVPVSLIDHPTLAEHRLDVMLADPRSEAARLYTLARLRSGAPTRVTIATLEGVARAGQVCLALDLPVRLLLKQPSTAALAELEILLERYLHDPRATAPMEPFNGALERLIHGAPTTLWSVLEYDPALYPSCVDDDLPRPHDAGFVQAHLARCLDEGAECDACALRNWCQGWFKWPDPSYGCAGVRALFDQVATAARQLARDAAELNEAPVAEGDEP